MRRSFYLRVGGLFAGFLLLASCDHMSGSRDAPLFPKLRAGAGLPAANARLTGTLVRDGDVLRVAGNGNTVVIWPIAGGAARTVPGIGTVVVVWPRSAALQTRSDGSGTTVVIWPRGVRGGTPVRVGDQVELSGIVLVDNLPAAAAAELSDIIVTIDNITGRLSNCPRARGCTGAVFVASEVRPAPAGSR